MTSTTPPPPQQQQQPQQQPAQQRRNKSTAAAVLVGAGILLSRIAGFARERAFAHVFGAGDAADIFRAAFRIPNLLQNLLGEGVLSASFIPSYAKLKKADEEQGTNDAAKLAGGVLALLSLVTTALVIAGVFGAPFLVEAIAPGFTDEKRAAAIACVRIFFPAMGLLVESAWCLGVLNTHGKFFASYAAPVAFNAVMIVVLIACRGTATVGAVGGVGAVVGAIAGSRDALFYVSWAAVGGAALQLLVQVPLVVPLVRGMSLKIDPSSAALRRVVTSFFPVLLSRGVVQIAAYVESMLASLLPAGAVATLGYAQILYTLPVSLFGMSVAASELPDMARASSSGDASGAGMLELTERISRSQKRIAFFVAPSACAFVFIGDALVSLVFQTGRFTVDDARIVWAILAGSAVGLVAATQGRLLSSAFFALGDTRTPFWFAVVRVAVGTSLGYAFSQHGLHLLALLHVNVAASAGAANYAVAGLSFASSCSAVVELSLLHRALRKRVTVERVPLSFLAKVVGAGVVAGAAGFAAKLGLAELTTALPPWLTSLVPIVVFGAVYGATTLALGVEQARALANGLVRRLRRGRGASG